MMEKIQTLLVEIQHELESSGHWQTVAPAPEKMMSTEPFSIDTLSFLEWLQWVYVARMQAILDAGTQLPSGAQVHPYAEESLKAAGISLPQVLALIKKLDSALNDSNH